MMPAKRRGETLIQRITRTYHLKTRKETTGVKVVLKDTGGKTAETIFRDLRRAGEVTVPFHLLVHSNGLVEEGRRPFEVGCPIEDPTGTLFIVWVDSQNETLTPEQVFSIEEIKRQFTDGRLNGSPE